MLAAAMLVVLLLTASAGVTVGAAVLGRHRAQSAADLAALAAAGRVGLGAVAACDTAASLVSAMAAGLGECRVDGLDVIVRADVTVRLGRFGLHDARGWARAGPATAEAGG